MRHWTDVQELAERTILGIIDSEGKLDIDLKNACEAAYRRGVFFCPAYEALKRKASELLYLAKEFKLMLAPPGLQTIEQAAAGNEGTSLKSLFEISVLVGVVRDCEDSKARVMSEYLRKHFGHPQVLENNSIIPAVWRPDPIYLKMLCPDASAGPLACMAVSAKLMKFAFKTRPPEHQFLGYLRDGYEGPSTDQPGAYLLTRHVAEVLHQRALASLPEEIPENFRHFASPVHEVGGRSGQISRALAVKCGNLLP